MRCSGATVPCPWSLQPRSPHCPAHMLNTRPYMVTEEPGLPLTLCQSQGSGLGPTSQPWAPGEGPNQLT